ncbi:fungal-specific transcription factor domain-containing protein [Podospora didyma]|uniref:Fungal-specific transcription factor domain-containing protein n=1 Tax=Podospora didyma TaxID=330526 RepID=A0AAE0NXU7_9PEZI|nr:fungal-specific transcription factor domain-containing protein [Podospora didyma]
MELVPLKPQPRQKPGSACEECRKRKLACDRQRPCKTCATTGVACRVNPNRLARGPKKGGLKTLSSRIDMIERRLSLDQMNEHSLLGSDTDDTAHHGLNNNILVASSASDREPSRLPSPCEKNLGWDSEIFVDIPPSTPGIAFVPPPPPNFQFPPSPPLQPKRPAIDELMRADLDQLYFDRVHPNVPIFCQSRYYAWSRQILITGGPSYLFCLQYAMWTLAMAQSSQFESFRDHLYGETRRMLDTLDLNEHGIGGVPIEQIQSWLLLAFYEFARTNFRRGWISAGRAFRLAQLAGLHHVDSSDSTADGEDPILTEERRRTFWLAYCLDRFVCMGNRLPLTLVEDVILTRLPSPELSFQNGHPIQMGFLSDAAGWADYGMLSSFAECAVIASLIERIRSHSQRSSTERAYQAVPADFWEFWERHERLAKTAIGISSSLTESYPVISAISDPMLYFALMMAHTTIIQLCQILESMRLEDQCGQTVLEFQNRAMSAAQNIAALVKAHEHVGYFKSHIFLPILVFSGASRLISHQAMTIDGARHDQQGSQADIRHGVDVGLESCINALEKIQSFNNLARDSRDRLYIVDGQDSGTGGYAQ